jgi:hypothetical protein
MPVRPIDRWEAPKSFASVTVPAPYSAASQRRTCHKAPLSYSKDRKTHHRATRAPTTVGLVLNLGDLCGSVVNFTLATAKFRQSTEARCSAGHSGQTFGGRWFIQAIDRPMAVAIWIASLCPQ